MDADVTESAPRNKRTATYRRHRRPRRIWFRNTMMYERQPDFTQQQVKNACLRLRARRRRSNAASRVPSTSEQQHR